MVYGSNAITKCWCSKEDEGDNSCDADPWTSVGVSRSHSCWYRRLDWVWDPLFHSLPFPFWVFVYLSSSTYLDRFVGWATRTCWSHWHGQWSVFPLFYILSDFSDDRIPLSLFFCSQCLIIQNTGFPVVCSNRCFMSLLRLALCSNKYWVPCSLFTLLVDIVGTWKGSLLYCG